ncbi:hypothetical protein U0070_012663, partial [Myodes glareolus]
MSALNHGPHGARGHQLLGGYTELAVCHCEPIWRVTFPEDETNPDARIWEGLWHMCRAPKSSGVQCTLYDTRSVVAQALSVSQVFIEPREGSMYHMSYWNTEAEIIRTASVIFLGIGFLVLMSLSWVAHNVSHGFSNP